MNGDGLLDLITGHGPFLDQADRLITVLTNKGGGANGFAFNRSLEINKNPGEPIALNNLRLTDINSDGKPDNLALYVGEGRLGGSVSALLNQNSLYTQAADLYERHDLNPGVDSDGIYIASGDFDNDGRPDIVVKDAFGNSIYVYRNRSIGEETSPVLSKTR
jgi:hypothetical protein